MSASSERVDRPFFDHCATPPGGGDPRLVRVYCCPCCGYPTLSEPAAYEICRICSWEDDGCDGGGPNAGSLDEARENFRKHLTSYGPTHELSPQFQRPGFRFVHQLELSPGNLEEKRRRIAALQQYMAEPNPRRRGELWRKLHGT
jgi:hypothetical protein